MTIGLFIPSLSKYDAMGNDVLQMYKILKELNLDTIIFTKDFDATIQAKIKLVDEAHNFLQNENNIIIYHHGIYFDFYQDIINSKCKKVFRYHNITYAELFEGYDDIAVQICKDGREQLKGTVDKFDYYLSCSNFNNNELIEDFDVDKEKTYILPPFHKIEDWINIQEDKNIKNELNKNSLNILSVGRLSPNKNYQLLIRGFADYCKNYNNKAVLNIVGKVGPLKYYEEILQLIKNLKIENNITLFSDGISEEKLKSLYMYSDIYITTSLHEGFCVPIVESMYFGLPIISSSETALQDTVGEHGILLDELFYINVSEAIKVAVEAKDYLSTISKNGYSNFSYNKSSKTFKNFMQSII